MYHTKNKDEAATSSYVPSIVSDVMKGLYDMYRLVYDPIEPSLYSGCFVPLSTQKRTLPEQSSPESFSRSVLLCVKPSSSRSVFAPARSKRTSPTPRRSPRFPTSRPRSSLSSRSPASPPFAPISPSSSSSTFSPSTGVISTSSTYFSSSLAT